MNANSFKIYLIITSLLFFMFNDLQYVLAEDKSDEERENYSDELIEDTIESNDESLNQDREESMEEDDPNENENKNIDSESSNAEDSNLKTLQNEKLLQEAQKYAIGDEGEHVRELKIQLTQLGFGNFPKDPSPRYGKVTANVVKEFQEYYNLPVTGIADETTRNKIIEVLNPPYKDGDRGLAIKELKQNLSKLGFGNFPPNPSINYGSITARIVMEFQSTYGLTADGITGENTLKLIESLLNSDYREGVEGEHVRELKIQLTQLGFGNFPKDPSPRYGKVTANVVKEFQEYYNLPVTGIADEEARNKIIEVLNPPYKDGDRGLAIKELKQNLSKLGFGNFPENPSIFYGSVTAKVVEEFQAMYGLKTTGEADQDSLDLINEILTSKYSIGQTGDHVRELKQKLTALGFGNFPSNPSNVYGEVTANVVKGFQAYYGLPQSGIVDEITLSKIEKELSLPYKDGSRGVVIAELKKNLSTIGFGNFPTNPSIFYGSVTARAVKDFQSFFGLKSTGVVDQETLVVIEYLVDNPLRNGSSGEFVVILKTHLYKLGFAPWEKPSDRFGENTAKRVENFQKYYGLPVTGEADDRTIRKLNSILNSPYQNGESGPHVVQLKKDLKELGFGNFPKDPSENYGDVTEKVVREFQEAYDLVVNGIADEVTLAKIKELLRGTSYTKYNLTLKEAVEIQMNQLPQTDKREYAWVSKTYIDDNHRVTADVLNVRTQPTTANTDENRILGTLSKGTKVDIIDEKGNWYAIKYRSTGSNWIHATREDVLYYLDPNNFINDPKQRYQFLDLSRPSGATAIELNKYLNDKGVLKEKGQAFIDAARLHGVNDIYLISHSLLETGHGTSKLAKGVRVGLNKKGEPERLTSSNENSLTKIETVYNVYGVGAYDSCPVDCGAKKAYEEGWDSVAKAIIGGAEFIVDNYIKQGQNTLYKMRWNPLMNEGMAWKQYATDIGWASKQINTMYDLYNEIGIDTLILDIPEYKK